MKKSNVFFDYITDIGLFVILIVLVLVLINDKVELKDKLKQKDAQIESIIKYGSNELAKMDSIKSSKPVDIPIIATTFNADPKQCNNNLTSASGIVVHDSLKRVVGVSRYLLFFHINFFDQIYIDIPGNKEMSGWYTVITTNADKRKVHMVDILIPKSQKHNKYKGKITAIKHS